MKQMFDIRLSWHWGAVLVELSESGEAGKRHFWFSPDESETELTHAATVTYTEDANNNFRREYAESLITPRVVCEYIAQKGYELQEE